MKVVVIHETGGPEVLKLEERPTPQPGPGQALLKMAAIGVNFVEIYQRSGVYQVDLPFVLGGEGAGTVETVGPGVTEVKPGDRVAWLGGSGTYATEALAPADKLVPLPDGISFELGAAAMVQGLTAYALSHETYRLQPGDRCLVHAAAGGVGLLLCQMAKMAGAYVIGTTSTEEKAQRAREAGANEVILYTQQDFEAEVKRITGGQGVQVVYDSVGKDTFDKSLACLAPRGLPRVVWPVERRGAAFRHPPLGRAEERLPHPAHDLHVRPAPGGFAAIRRCRAGLDPGRPAAPAHRPHLPACRGWGGPPGAGQPGHKRQGAPGALRAGGNGRDCPERPRTRYL